MDENGLKENNFILKQRGKNGIISAVFVVGIVTGIVLLSKLNEIRHQRLPALWRRRVRSMVLDSAKHIRICEDASDIKVAHYHAIMADAILKSCKNLVGNGSLEKISRINVEQLESDIEKWLHTKPQSLDYEDDEKPLVRDHARNTYPKRNRSTSFRVKNFHPL